MKNLIIAAIMLFGIITFAQEKKEKKAEREPLTAAQQAELRVKRMTLDLDLNEKQQREVQKIVLEQTTMREAKRAEMKKQRESGKKFTADEKFAVQSKMLDNRIAMKSELKKILTPEQMAKLEAKEAPRKGKMMRRKSFEHKKHTKEKNE